MAGIDSRDFKFESRIRSAIIYAELNRLVGPLPLLRQDKYFSPVINSVDL